MFRLSDIVLLPNVFIVLGCMQSKACPFIYASNSDTSPVLFHVSSLAAQSFFQEMEKANLGANSVASLSLFVL